MKIHTNTGRLSLGFIFFLITAMANAQQTLDFQLRLEPVWSRVADALGERGSVESAEFHRMGNT